METAALDTEPRPGALRRYSAFALVALATASLAVFPVAICFDCDGQKHFGQPAGVPDWNFILFAIWLVLAPFLAAAFRIRQAWLVPIGVTLAHLAVQHLRDRPWWNIRASERPILLIMDMTVGFASFFLGILARKAVETYRHQKSAASAH